MSVLLALCDDIFAALLFFEDFGDDAAHFKSFPKGVEACTYDNLEEEISRQKQKLRSKIKQLKEEKALLSNEVNKKDRQLQEKQGQIETHLALLTKKDTRIQKLNKTLKEKNDYEKQFAFDTPLIYDFWDKEWKGWSWQEQGVKAFLEKVKEKQTIAKRIFDDLRA